MHARTGTVRSPVPPTRRTFLKSAEHRTCSASSFRRGNIGVRRRRFSRRRRVEWRREPLWAATRGGRVEWRDTLAWPPWRKVAYAPGPASCSYFDHFPCACRFSSRGSSAMATFRKSCGPADSVAVASRLPTSCRVPAAACIPARPALPWTAVAVRGKSCCS